MNRTVKWLLVSDEGVWLLFSDRENAEAWQKMVWLGKGLLVRVLDFPAVSSIPVPYL